ncbi:DUF637 domain-containing protein [Pseudomonas sp. SCB32]|uniref:DUF637 domain-containing protein n=1 Tax=Pseudomonas sp. SCB32 TaxID=2653853 RepID=UPI0035566680
MKAVGSEISAGSDITLISGGDQKYQGAKLESGNDLSIVSGGEVVFEAVKDLHQESHEKSNSDLAWSSAKGKGNTDETVRQSELTAQGNLTIKAVDGLKIDYKHLDQQSVSQAIDAMVKADPNLAWIKDAAARGDVDWRAVKELHDSYSYSSSGMGPATQLAVAIAAAAIGGMAAAGALSSAGVAGGSFAMGAGVGAAGSLAGTAGVSLINNKGDLGKVLSDSFSSDNLKQMAIASLTGGLTAEYFNSLSGADTHTKIVGGKTVADLSSWGGVGSFAASQGMQNFTSTALSQALDQGGSFGDALKNSLYNTFAAAGFNQVGDIGAINGYAPGSAPMVAMHALMGGLASVVSGGDFATGAVAAGANEAMVASLDDTFKKLSPDQREQLLTTSSQLVGLVATAAVIQNASTDQLETGVWAAKNSTQYNYLFHEELDEMARKIQGCGADKDCKDRIGQQYSELDQQRNNEYPALCQSDLAACGKIAARLMAEDPQNVELALSLHKAQTVGLEAVISTNYIQSNRMAMDTATSEYLAQTGGTTELLKMALAQSAAGGLIGGSGSSFNKLLPKGAGTAAEASSVFSQQRSFWSKEPIQFSGNKVYQRDDLFDPNLVSSWRDGGKVVSGTNIERMASGRAPIGVDGKSVNLHHTTQTQDGPIAEMTQTFHQQNSSVIHINPNTIPSGIDRIAFDKWKAQYWEQRAAGYGGIQ